MARRRGATGLASRPVSLADLTGALRRAWGEETSSDPSIWSASNPAWGQCAVTALIVQDHFGGGLLRGTVDGSTHYWNLLPSGETVDLTLYQFGPEPPSIVQIEPRSREYVLAFPETVRRYRRLRRKVHAYVRGAS
jgi:hypothetical protein